MANFFDPFGESKKSGGGGAATDAADVSFDNTSTDLSSDNVQDVILEVQRKLNQRISDLDATQIAFTDPLGHNINVQTALEELYGKNPIYFASYLDFPNTGKEDVLYIAKDTNIAYLWIPSSFTYRSLTIDDNDTNYTIRGIL